MPQLIIETESFLFNRWQVPRVMKCIPAVYLYPWKEETHMNACFCILHFHHIGRGIYKTTQAKIQLIKQCILSSAIVAAGRCPPVLSTCISTAITVSYTHLTLPTQQIV